MLEFFAERIAELIARDAKLPRWEYVTACFGWIAAAALLSCLFATLVSFSTVAGYAAHAFAFSITVALSRDWRRLTTADLPRIV